MRKPNNDDLILTLKTIKRVFEVLFLCYFVGKYANI